MDPSRVSLAGQFLGVVSIGKLALGMSAQLRHPRHHYDLHHVLAIGRCLLIYRYLRTANTNITDGCLLPLLWPMS